MIYNNIESVYSAVIKKTEAKLREKYNAELENNPNLLFELLKEMGILSFNGLSQKTIYPFAQLSIQGHMPLIENKCRWENKYICVDGIKPVFVKDRKCVPDCYLEIYDRNPFSWGSDLSGYDGSFNVVFSFERTAHGMKSIPNYIEITIIVNKDFGRSTTYRADRNGQAHFVFRVSTKNNDKNINLILGHFKDYIIGRKIKNIMDNSFDKITEDISEQIFSKLLV